MNQLGISLSSIIFQLINFVLLLWLLKKLLYKPILKVLDDRKNSVVALEADKTKIAKELENLDASKEKALDKTRQEADKIIREANKEAGAMKDKIIQDAYTASQKMIEDAKAAAQAEKKEIIESVKDDLAGVSIRAAEGLILTKLTSGQKDILLEKTVGMLTKDD